MGSVLGVQTETFRDIDRRWDFGGHMKSAAIIYYTGLAQGPYGLEDEEYGVGRVGYRVEVELVDR